MILNIVIVGYNEEVNLKKCLKSIEYFKGLIDFKIIYVDQSSTDNSIEIVKSYTNNIYIHENKGYADPDKKWVIENIIKDNEWVLILDADEEISEELALEISKKLKNDLIKIFNIKVKVYYLLNSYIYFRQIRLFQKNSVIMTNEIHNYITPNIKTKELLKNSIINIDLKDRNNFIFNNIDKINRYSEKEILKIKKISKIKIIFFMFIKPIYIFIKWGIYNKLFLHGISGIVTTVNITFYNFTIYSKLYEKYYNKNN